MEPKRPMAAWHGWPTTTTNDRAAGEKPVLDLLTEQERIVMQGCLLPDSGSLSPEQREEVRQLLLAHIKEHGLKQAQVARQTGIADSTFSQICNGTHDKPKLDLFLREINNWLAVDARRRTVRPNKKCIQTIVAKRIMIAASRAAEHGAMWAAYGPTGIGKTFMAHIVVEKFPASVYIRVSRGNTGYRAFRRTLGDMIGMFSSRLRPDMSGRSIDERIFDRLRDTNRLIVIDEAHRLSDAALEFLRDLNDEAGVPMLLLCTKDLRERLLADADADHGQLYSRFNFMNIVDGHDATPGNGKTLFLREDIKKMFASERVRLTTDAESILHEMANRLGRGSLRLCRKVMNIAEAATRAKDELGPDEVVVVDGEMIEKIEGQYCEDRAVLKQTREQRRMVRSSTA